jgi:hypothetical protein
MTKWISDVKAYKKVVGAFRARKKGATVADIAAGTGLPLYTVKELAPAAADEFGGRLEVTESGEILYSFPQGFVSRYRGFGPLLKKSGEKLARFLGAAGTVLFKGWIMVMLLGYFVLFMALALLSLFVSISANSRSSSNSSRRDGGGFMLSGLFNLIIRIWFYSELTRSFDPSYRRGRFEAPKPKGRLLHKAIFSFVFGDGNPNANWEETERKDFAAYVLERQGVLSLPEFIAITGLPPGRAERELTTLCVEFGGTPEVTEEGTVVYRFNDLLRRADSAKAPGDIPLHFKKLRSFSTNPGKMNFWFTLINGVNLLFGSYFLYNAFSVGAIPVVDGYYAQAGGYIYRVAYALFAALGDPMPFITLGLGLIPLAFSVLFWLIPALRYGFLKKTNKEIKEDNFRKFCFSRIWSAPLALKLADLNPAHKEASPAGLASARDKILKEMGSYAIPEVSMDGGGEVYSFPDLEREKAALKKYRASINPADSSLGKTVFDSNA